MTIQQFKNKLNTLNDILYFDQNDYLREKTSNPEEIRRIIVYGEKLIQTTQDKIEIYFLKGNLGNFYRILGESKKAIHYLEEALQRAKGNITKEIITLVRLGEALKYDYQHNEALELFEQALNHCNEHNVTTYLDFVLQHKGKCLLELKQIDDAKICFKEALDLREIKGNQSLIESTKIALTYCQSIE